MKKLALGVLVALFGAAVLCFGQATDANLVGTVVDATGALVPNANIELANEATGVKSSTRTDANGLYRFNNMPAGRYDVSASATGFAKATVKAVDLELNKNVTTNITLQVGSVSASVEVSEAAATIDTTTAQLQTSFDARQITDLPIVENSSVAGKFYGALNLSLLSAGVGSNGGVGQGIGPSVGGQRPTENNFTIEGVDNNNKALTGPLVYVPTESTSEFTLLTNQYGAEFGHSTGGQFSTVVKGGTNEIHGSVYEYFQNRNLDALDQGFARQGYTSHPRFDQNRLGMTMGGPIIKDKLFWFGSVEYAPLGAAYFAPGTTVYAPTAAGYSALSGILGTFADQPEIPGAIRSRGSGGQLQSDDRERGEHSDRNSARRGNAVQQLLDGGRKRELQPQRQRPSAGTVRLQQIQQHRHQRQPAELLDAAAAALVPDDGFRLPHLLADPDQRVSPGIQPFQPVLHRREPGFPGLDALPNITFDNDLGLQVGPDPNAPQFTVQNTYELVENINWTKGKHTFKFGFDGRDYISPQFFIQRVRGDYDYANLQEYLSDQIPTDLAERNLGNTPYYGNQWATYLYATDQWRIRHNLTLDLGLRWERTTVAETMKLQNLNAVANTPGLINFNSPTTANKNFAPRIGVAYLPGNRGTTSIRAGFGMGYDVIYDNVGLTAYPPQLSPTIDACSSPGNCGRYSLPFLAQGGIRPTDVVVGTNLTPAQARAQTSTYLPNQELPYAIQWNVGVQHVFHNDFTLEVRYLGTRGVHLLMQDQINKTNPPVTATQNLPTYLSAPSQAQLDALPLTLAQLAGDQPAGPPVRGRGVHQQYHGVHAYRQPDLPRPGDTVDAPFRPWPAIRGRLHLEPQHRRQHRLALLDGSDAAAPGGFRKPEYGTGQLRSRPAAAPHHDLVVGGALAESLEPLGGQKPDR